LRFRRDPQINTCADVHAVRMLFAIHWRPHTINRPPSRENKQCPFKRYICMFVE
jgi:hypothetical protein